MTILFAQTAGQALDTLENSLDLSQKTVESWGSVWAQTIYDYQQSGLWIALVELGLTFAALSVVYLAFTEGKPILERQSWSQLATLFIWPIVVAIFLANNGALLAQSVKFVHLFGLSQIEKVQQTQVAGMTIRNALETITITDAAYEQIQVLVDECSGKQGSELPECLRANQEAIEQIVAEAEAKKGESLNTLRNFVGQLGTTIGLVTDPQELTAAIFRHVTFPIIRALLSAIQWAYINMLEAALLITATFAPVAMGLTLLPLQGRPIFAWLIGFISLLGIQLGYSIVVGLAAIVIVHSGGELLTDVAFLFFLSVFAPALAVLVIGFGGLSVYRAIAGNTKAIVDLLSIGATAGFNTLNHHSDNSKAKASS